MVFAQDDAKSDADEAAVLQEEKAGGPSSTNTPNSTDITPKKKVKKKKDGCPCAVPRLVRRGMPRGAMSLSRRSILAWLDPDGRRQLAAFAEDKETVLWTPEQPKPTISAKKRARSTSAKNEVATEKPGKGAASLALFLESFSLDSFGTPQQAQGLLRRVTTSPPAGVRMEEHSPLPKRFFLGMKKAKAKQPLDRWEIDAAADVVDEKPRGAPLFHALFLGPFEERDRAGCGETRSHLVWPEEDLTAPSAIAWVVEGWTDDEKKRKVALVDHRHLVTFGVGHVEKCQQGLMLDEGPMTIRLRPVSVDFSVGAPWTFQTQGRPNKAQLDEARKLAKEAAEETFYSARRGRRFLPMPQLQVAPESHKSWLKNPFLEGVAPPTLSHEKDAVALGAMLLMLIGTVLLAWFLRIFKKPRALIVEVECPSCDDIREVDLQSGAVDGSSCPKCGKSVLYVSTSAAGPLPHVSKL
ncbi:MAG: hypothetical protein GY822_24365 [Deltaproteobacteria bacterium]|nr:hypothetical protein [Deltaproteobacteria bacterium]